MEKLAAKAQKTMSTTMDIQQILQTQKVLRSLYLVVHQTRFAYQLTQVSRRLNVIESEDGLSDPQQVMADVGLNPDKKREVYAEIKSRIKNSKFWKAGSSINTMGETILMNESMRKNDYFKPDGRATDFDDILKGIVENVWDNYDTNRTGTLDKDHCRFFAKDLVREMTVSGINLKFEEQEYQDVFAEIDEDGSGTVDKDEAIELIKRIRNHFIASSETKEGVMPSDVQK
jgi:hypothetical protein